MTRFLILRTLPVSIFAISSLAVGPRGRAVLVGTSIWVLLRRRGATKPDPRSPRIRLVALITLA